MDDEDFEPQDDSVRYEQPDAIDSIALVQALSSLVFLSSGRTRSAAEKDKRSHVPASPFPIRNSPPL
jgi:hypothetical protein